MFRYVPFNQIAMIKKIPTQLLTSNTVYTEEDTQIDSAYVQDKLPQGSPSLETQPAILSASTWQELLLPYLGMRVVLVIVGLLVNFYLLPLMTSHPVLPSHDENLHFPQALWLMWRRFDSGFYLGIAQNGYWPASTLHSPSNWAFYPLYPLLISLFGHLFGGTRESFMFAGLFISNVSAILAGWYLYRLLSQEFGKHVAIRTILYTSLFPLAFYLSAIYTESLFLLFAVAALYYARRQSWWLAGLSGGLAALTRSQGVLLTVPLACEYVRVLAERYAPLPGVMPVSLAARISTCFTLRLRGLLLAIRDMRNWLNSGFILLIPASLLTFMIYAWMQTGDLLATLHTDRWGWGRQLSSPWRLLIYSLRHPVLGAPMEWNFWVLNMVLAFTFLGFTLWAFRRLPSIYASYTLVMVVLPLSANQLNSLGRFYLTIFPAFLLLALWTLHKDRNLVHTFIVSSFAAFQALFMAFYVLGIPAIA